MALSERRRHGNSNKWVQTGTKQVGVQSGESSMDRVFFILTLGSTSQKFKFYTDGFERNILLTAIYCFTSVF